MGPAVGGATDVEEDKKRSAVLSVDLKTFIYKLRVGGGGLKDKNRGE